MGNDFALFCFFFSVFVQYSFILCKKKNNKKIKTKQETKLITDAIYFLFDQQMIWRWTGCVCVRPKSEWARGVRSRSDREQAEPGSFFFSLSLSFLGDRVPLPNVSLKTTDCFFIVVFWFVFFKLDTWTLPVACFATKHSPSWQPSQSAWVSKVWKFSSSPEGQVRVHQLVHTHMTFIQQLLSNSKFNRVVSGRGTIKTPENSKPVFVVSKWGSNVFIHHKQPICDNVLPFSNSRLMSFGWLKPNKRVWF